MKLSENQLAERGVREMKMKWLWHVECPCGYKSKFSPWKLASHLLAFVHSVFTKHLYGHMYISCADSEWLTALKESE